MTHHELMMENEVLKTNLKKLLEIVFMDWEEEWRKEGGGSWNQFTGEVRNPNILSCNRHNGCYCGGAEKIRAMFGTDELEELYDVLEKL